MATLYHVCQHYLMNVMLNFSFLSELRLTIQRHFESKYFPRCVLEVVHTQRVGLKVRESKLFGLGLNGLSSCDLRSSLLATRTHVRTVKM